MKENKKNFWRGFGFSFGIIIILIFLLLLVPSNVKWDFYIDETSEPLVGRVYLNGEYLGETNDKGGIKISSDEIYPGEISLVGSYNQKQFSYFWNLERNELSFTEMDWYVTKDEIENLEFDSSKINEEEIEKEIFELINSERQKENLVLLKRSSILDDLAKEYSQQMADENFFDHIDPSGRDIHDRLVEKRIFNFMATEDISLNYPDKDTNFAEEVVSGWMKSPGHRIPIMAKDTIWDHVGIGVNCQDNKIDLLTECYITAEFVSFEQNLTGEIKKGYVSSIPLYPEELGLDFNVPIYINFTSTRSVDLILVPDEKQFDKYINRNSIEKIFKKGRIRSYEDTIEIGPGYSLIMDSNDNYIEYSLYLKYNPE